MNQINEQETKTDVNHKLIVLELKAQAFIDSHYDIKSYYSVYKGKLIGSYGSNQEKLIDFLIEMEELDFTNEEVNHYLIERYWNNKEE